MISLKELKVKYNHNDSFAPKSQDEKRFRDKHKVEVTADRNGNKDDVFKATNIKTFDREKEHGYNIGKDVEVYEEHDMPFDKPYKTKSATVTDKSGAKHSPESRVKNLARQTLMKLAPKPKGEPIVTVAPAKGDKVAEEVEEIDERTLSSAETAEKEKIVKGMKKKMAGFKEKYGERAKSVMYATATKMAKGD